MHFYVAFRGRKKEEKKWENLMVEPKVETPYEGCVQLIDASTACPWVRGGEREEGAGLTHPFLYSVVPFLLVK